MDLKIKDVADLLNVSETTIRRWLTDGKIPAYKINNQYRFNRSEIQSWLTGQRIDGPKIAKSTHAHIPTPEIKVSGGSKQFCLYRALHKGAVHADIPGNEKEIFIRNAMKQIAQDLSLDADVLSELFLERERMQSTALNNGIAVPHTRDFLLNGHQDVVVVVFPEDPLSFGALDGQPVHTCFFLFASDDKRHLHLLAKIAHLSTQKEALDLLRSKPPKEALMDFIKTWESSIQQLLKEE